MPSPSPSKRTLSAASSANSGPSPPADVAALDLPVLCIAGEEDIVVPPAAVEAFARALPRGEYVAVPAAGHSVYFERADAFNALVLDFLRRTA